MTKKTILQNILIIFICIIFISGLTTIIYIHRIKMPTTHIFVCDNKDNYSDFDNWLRDEISWVPTYFIFKDKQEIGYIRGTIDVKSFSKELKSLCKNPKSNRDLPNYKITNLNDESKSLQDIIVDDDIYILEVHWIDCPDCKEQDNKYSKSIYAKYGTNHIYRYYLKSDKNKVIKAYK